MRCSLGGVDGPIADRQSPMSRALLLAVLDLFGFDVHHRAVGGRAMAGLGYTLKSRTPVRRPKLTP